MSERSCNCGDGFLAWVIILVILWSQCDSLERIESRLERAQGAEETSGE